MTKCPDNNNCGTTIGPNFNVDGNGISTKLISGGSTSCVSTVSDNNCPPIPTVDPNCTGFDLTENNDNCFIHSVVNESLKIGGAKFNVYKLLGIHEQNKLIDVVGHGMPISNGDLPNYPAINAFTPFTSTWRSIQSGDAVTASAFIGYDFGEIKLIDGSRNKYGIDTRVRKHITAFKIKQSSNPNQRATSIRIERSEDGIKWFGVQVVELPDDDCYNLILIRDSVPSRYWRFRPVTFSGGSLHYWEIQAIELYDNYVATDEYNIQDKILFENRDRDYLTDPIQLKGFYDLVDTLTEISKWEVGTPSQSLYAQVSFASCVAQLGRPLIIGDIIELPSEAQYSAKLKKIQKWLEVTDVAWSAEGFTPGWNPTLLRVILQPVYHSQETQDIFGDLAETPDNLGYVDNDNGQHAQTQDYFDISQTIQAEAKEMVPEQGAEGSSAIRQWEQSELDSASASGYPHLQKIGLNSTGLYVEDAMPPNNAPYTKGPDFPSDPSDGDYHRIEYVGLSKDVPARLYRFSEVKNRWIFLEKDRRGEFDPTMPKLQEFLKNPTPHTDITED